MLLFVIKIYIQLIQNICDNRRLLRNRYLRHPSPSSNWSGFAGTIVQLYSSIITYEAVGIHRVGVVNSASENNDLGKCINE